MATKRLSTNQKFQALQNYVVSCINDPDSNESFASDKDAVSWAYAHFRNEYLHEANKTRYRNNEREAFKAWLTGLSYVRVAFTNYEIIKLGKEFQLLRKNASESSEYDFIDRWFNLMTGQIFVLKVMLNA